MARRSHLNKLIAGRSVIFEQIQPNIFQLQTSPDDGHLINVYYVTIDSSPVTDPPATLDLNGTWNIAGAYAFTLADPAPSAAQLAVLATLVTGQLTGVPTVGGHVPHGFAWTAGNLPTTQPPGWPTAWTWMGVKGWAFPDYPYYRTTKHHSFKWGQFELNFTKELTYVGVYNERLVIFTYAANSATDINITYNDKSSGFCTPLTNDIPSPGTPINWNINISLKGSTTGSFEFITGAGYFDLVEHLALGFVYAYALSADCLYYPLFDPTNDPSAALTLRVFLNPILPRDGRATRFIQLPPPADGGPNMNYRTPLRAVPILSTSNLFTTNGKPLTLERVHPAGQLPAGFAFSVTPPDILMDSSQSDPNYYLSPVGVFKLPASQVAPVDVMPGMSGLEYLRLQPGDLIELVNDQPAYAPGFTIPGGSSATGAVGTDPLVNTYTTSWVRIPTPASGPTRSYFSQPVTSTYFGPGLIGNPAPYPEAVQSRLCDFGPASPTPTAFPLIPYGAVFKSFAGSPLQAAGDDIGGDGVTAFEASVLASQRHSLLATSPTGPIFMPAGAAAPSNKLSSALTPQGLIVLLNTDIAKPPLGAWTAIQLARTPEQLSFGDSSLVFNAPPSDLSNVLTREQLFLVIADPSSNINWSTKADHTNLIKMGGFAFFFDLIQANAAGPTALVLKFNNQMSLQYLVAQPSLWAESEKFAPNQAKTRDLLTGLIDQALNPPSGQVNPFADFAALAVDKSWTGVIAFNVQVDGNEMDSDFQMLLGGMQTDLRAHHIGIEANLLDPTKPAIDQSSMFGVICYPPPGVSPAPPPRSAALANADDLHYVVEQLVVVFKNSAVTLFEATADLIVNAIFGRPVKLSGGPGNTIKIHGQYQVHDGVGTVVFQSTQEFDFTFAASPGVRVLDKLRITRAKLVPIVGSASGSSIASTTILSPDGTPVRCAFSFEGQLWFNQAPFPAASSADSVDLFSYGTGTAGMAYTSLNVIINFTLGADGSPTGPSIVAADYTQLLPLPTFDAVRTDSLLHRLPAQFSRFLADSNASSDLSKATAAALPIHCAQLTGSGSSSLAPLATHNPTFALEYDVSLGSLGSLSDGHGINAKLLIGWGPSAFSPDDDAGGLLMQLPQLSAGIAGFNIEGVLQVQLGVGNLARVTLSDGSIAYAILFNNAQLSAIGLTLPPGIQADVLIFAKPGNLAGVPPSNLAWFLAAGAGTP